MPQRPSALPPVVATLTAAAISILGAPHAVTADTAPKPPTRPIVVDVVTLDYAALPLLEKATWASCSYVTLHVGREGGSILQANLETKPAPPRWKVSGLPADANLRIGRRHYVAETPSYARPFLGTTEEDPVKSEAEWLVVDRTVTTADRASVSRCAGRAKIETPFAAATVEKGEAAALVPDRVYAYRRCVSGCDEPLGSDARVEELGIVTSPALYVSSSDWGANGFTSADSFARGFATVRPGTTATLVVGLPPTQAGLGPLRSSKATTGADTFDIEVVWQTGGEPAMTLFSGHVDGAPHELAVHR